MTVSKKKNAFAKLLLNSGATVFVVNQIYACVSPETLIKTESGTRPMSSIKTGDLVFTTEGLQEVISKVEYKDVPLITEKKKIQALKKNRKRGCRLLWRGIFNQRTDRQNGFR